MTAYRKALCAGVGFILGLAMTAGASARAETLDSKIADTRTLVAFKVRPEAAESWLPQGYRAVAIPGGPFKSANFLLFFIDRLLHLSPDGEPKDGGSYRMVAVVIPGKHAESGEPAMFIARIYSPHGGVGPYANSVQSAVRRESSRSGEGVGAAGGSDRWEIEHDGGTLSVAMEFQLEVPRLVEAESHPVSAADPNIRRIYRYRQLLDVVRSVPAEIDRVTSLDVGVSIPELVDAFDGSEQLVGIGVIPWYTRETYSP